MALPAFASLADLDVRIPGGVSTDEVPRATAALDDASALIRAEAGKTWVNESNQLADVPDVVVAVTLAAARRAMTNPDGLASESVEDYSRSFSQSSTSLDVYLTRGERRVVRRAAGLTGLWTLSTTRSDVATDVPAIASPYVASSIIEEVDPLDEGWTG